MTPVRMLGLCGLVASLLTGVGGAAGHPVLVGLAGFIMLFANLYALIWGGKGSS